MASPKTELGGEATRTEAQPRARRIAFRGIAWIMTLFLVVMFPFSLAEVIVMWLPDGTLLSMIPDLTEADLSHRTHFLSVGIIMWALLLGIVVQLRKPERRVAPMLQAVVLTVAGMVLFGLTGTFGEFLIEDAVMFVPVAVLAWLHPRARKLITRPEFNREMAWLAAVAGGPWAIFAIDHIRLQITDATSHAEMEHWAASAMVAIVIVAFGFIGSSALEGWRLPAWIASFASVIYGLHSIIFPGLASALPIFWAVAAVVWAVAFGVSIFRRSHREQTSRDS